MKDLSVYEELCNEINAGPFSILGEPAKNRIKDMIRLAMEDGYNRGAEDAVSNRGVASVVVTKHSATGLHPKKVGKQRRVVAAGKT